MQGCKDHLEGSKWSIKKIWVRGAIFLKECRLGLLKTSGVGCSVVIHHAQDKHHMDIRSLVAVTKPLP